VTFLLWSFDSLRIALELWRFTAQVQVLQVAFSCTWMTYLLKSTQNIQKLPSLTMCRWGQQVNVPAVQTDFAATVLVAAGVGLPAAVSFNCSYPNSAKSGLYNSCTISAIF
jgi:hypothetical protein